MQLSRNISFNLSSILFGQSLIQYKIDLFRAGDAIDVVGRNPRQPEPVPTADMWWTEEIDNAERIAYN